MKTETNAAYFTGFFARTFKHLQVTGLPLAEVLLLEEEASKLSPETLALAMAHAYERALAIQKGMAVVEVWFIPQTQKEGHECAYATCGASHREAKMEYVLTHMTLPIPMDAWMREYS